MTAEEKLAAINNVFALYDQGLEKKVEPRATTTALNRGFSEAAIRDAQLSGRFPTEAQQRNEEAAQQESIMSIYEAMRQIRKLASGE